MMDEQANPNDRANPAIDATTPPADGEPAATCGVEQQAFVPAGAYATGIGGRRALWPVAIGAVSVVLAGQDLLKLIGSFCMILFRGSLYRLPGQLVSEFKNIDARAILGLGLGIGSLIPPLLLLSAGLLIWRQHRRALGLHRAYAILMIILNLASPIILFYTYPETLRLNYAFHLIWQATIAVIYPVFLLIWFSRAKVRAETRLWR